MALSIEIKEESEDCCDCSCSSCGSGDTQDAMPGMAAPAGPAEVEPTREELMAELKKLLGMQGTQGGMTQAERQILIDETISDLNELNDKQGD
jgi:hypothetical protein